MENLITLKIKYSLLNNADRDTLLSFIKNYNNVYRFTANRLLENPKLSTKEITELQGNLNNILIDSHLKNSCIFDVKTLVKQSDQGDKIVFGGKQLLNKRNKHQISNGEWKLQRLVPLCSVGEAYKKANRKFTILSSSQVLFKPNRNIHIVLNLCSLRKNWKSQLERLLLLQNQKLLPITYRLDLDYIYITYDCNLTSTSKPKGKILDRILSIDMNPNYLGYDICDWRGEYPNRIVKSEVLSLKPLNDKDNGLKSKGLNSSSKERTYIKNKREYEIIQLAHQIVKQTIHYKCELIAIEDLTISPGDLNKGKRLNKLCNNQWCRDRFVQVLEKLCRLNNVKLLKMPANYSSYIGNLCYRKYNLPDMCLSALEIGRRNYEFNHQYLLKDKDIEKNIVLNNSQEFISNAKQSLEELGLHLDINLVDLKQVFKEVKNSKLRYRVQLDGNQCCFRKFYKKKYMDLYRFV